MAKLTSHKLGHLRASPMPSRGKREGKSYWRIRTTTTPRRTVTSGWWSTSEIPLVLGALVARGEGLVDVSARADTEDVGTLVDRWEAHQVNRQRAGKIAHRTLASRRLTASYWRGALGEVLLTQLTRAMVEDQCTEWLAEGLAPRTVRLAAQVFQQIVRWGAERFKTVPSLDLRRLDATKVDKADFVYTSRTPKRHELDAVIDLVTEPRARQLIELLSYTGARAGEIGAAHVRSYDRDAQELELWGRDEERKRRGKVQARRFPVMGDLLVLLEGLTAGRDLDDRLVADLPGDVAAFAGRALTIACEQAGVERFTSHGIRRLVAMELLDSTDPKSVSLLTGHSVEQLLRTYIRPDAARLRDAVARSGVARRRGRSNVIELRAAGLDEGE